MALEYDIAVDFMDMTDDRMLWARTEDLRGRFEPMVGRHAVVGDGDAAPRVARIVDRYCVDVLTQISAIRSALESVAIGLLDGHVRHCVADAVTAGGPEATERLDEATAAIARLIKS